MTAHPDDYTYGVAGTLMAHADDERHVVVLAPIQEGAAREVASRLGVELHLLDGEYKKIAANAASLKEQLTALLAANRPDYVFAPPQVGDWSPDHTCAAQIAFESFLDSGSLGQWNARFLRYPIPATTTSFTANVWVELPQSMIETKMELAATMTRGAEDIWPRDVVEWEIQSQHRFAHRGRLAGDARRGLRRALSDPGPPAPSARRLARAPPGGAPAQDGAAAGRRRPVAGRFLTRTRTVDRGRVLRLTAADDVAPDCRAT